MWTRLTLVALLALVGPAGVGLAESDADSADAASHDSDHGDDSHGEGGHAADSHGGGGHGGGAPDPLATDPDLAIWTAVVFVGMLLILSQVAWKPIMAGLAMREATIAGNYKAADDKHEEAKAMLAQHQAKLAAAADEVKSLLDEARRDAENVKVEIEAKGKAEAQAMVERANKDIELAKDVVVRDLAERTAGLAIDLAAKVVRQDITPERQSEIVGDALGRFASSEPSAN